MSYALLKTDEGGVITNTNGYVQALQPPISVQTLTPYQGALQSVIKDSTGVMVTVSQPDWSAIAGQAASADPVTLTEQILAVFPEGSGSSGAAFYPIVADDSGNTISNAALNGKDETDVIVFFNGDAYYYNSFTITGDTLTMTNGVAFSAGDDILLQVGAMGGGGSSTLAGLTDVNLTSPTEGQVLTYDAGTSKWINADTGGSSANLILNKTSGGQVGYITPLGYTFDINTLYSDEVVGTITKVSETYPPAAIPYPSGWTYQPTIPMRYWDGTIRSTMTENVFRAAYKVAGKKYYAATVADGGSASNTGLTAASPLTLEAAYGKTDVVEIELLDGFYTAMTDFPTGGFLKTLSVYCTTGKAYIGRITQTDSFRHIDPTPTPDIWFSQSAGLGGLLYLNEFDIFGNNVPLTKVFTQADMLSTENTYYVIPFGDPDYPGTYFHLASGFTPNNYINCLLIETQAFAVLDIIGTPSLTNQTLYLENIIIVGQCAGRMNAGCAVYANNSSFLYSQNDGDELFFQNGTEVVLYKCNTGYCALDGFSYTGTINAAEIECTGIYANLYNGNASNQISTAHSNTTIVRIGCDYRNSQYATTDVTGSSSFNVGIIGDNTVGTPFLVWDGSATGYFIDCTSNHSGALYGARNTAAAYLQGPKEPIAANPESGGTIKYYEYYE